MGIIRTITLVALRGSMLGLSDYLLTKYLVVYHALPWTTSRWIVGGVAAWWLSLELKRAVISVLRRQGIAVST